jgi:hypothetical protein
LQINNSDVNNSSIEFSANNGRKWIHFDGKYDSIYGINYDNISNNHVNNNYYNTYAVGKDVFDRDGLHKTYTANVVGTDNSNNINNDHNGDKKEKANNDREDRDGDDD